jgi:hypothetical protein
MYETGLTLHRLLARRVNEKKYVSPWPVAVFTAFYGGICRRPHVPIRLTPPSVR